MSRRIKSSGAILNWMKKNPGIIIPFTVDFFPLFLLLFFQDGISDGYLQRTEQRNGLLTTGSWESADGFFKYKCEFK